MIFDRISLALLFSALVCGELNGFDQLYTESEVEEPVNAKPSQNIQSKRAKQFMTKDEIQFMSLYKQSRAEQLTAIKSLQNLKKYEKQYGMVDLLSSSIADTLKANRAVLEASGYIPGVSDFPEDMELKNALASTMENAAFFSEIVLRLPEITSRILKKSHELEVLYQWGLTFLEENQYLADPATIKLLGLVQQELNYTERHPDYFNPYKMNSQSKSNKYNGNDTYDGGKKVKRKIPKGPTLSRVEL